MMSHALLHRFVRRFLVCASTETPSKCGKYFGTFSWCSRRRSCCQRRRSSSSSGQAICSSTKTSSTSGRRGPTGSSPNCCTSNSIRSTSKAGPTSCCSSRCRSTCSRHLCSSTSPTSSCRGSGTRSSPDCCSPDRRSACSNFCGPTHRGSARSNFCGSTHRRSRRRRCSSCNQMSEQQGTACVACWSSAACRTSTDPQGEPSFPSTLSISSLPHQSSYFLISSGASSALPRELTKAPSAVNATVVESSTAGRKT